jgi:RNA polymerase-binding transcription factor DksA
MSGDRGYGWTKARLRAIERRLQEHRDTLAREIDADLRKQSTDRDGLIGGNVPDRAEQALVDWVSDLDLAEAERDVAELYEVEAALQRIAAGRYGDCSDCGRTIDVARLEQTPHAGRCIGRQEQFEQRLRSGKRATL